MSRPFRTPVSLRHVSSFDGTKLAVYEAGDASLPPMVLCNGLGGHLVVWRDLIERFAERYRIYGWDYRGLYASGPAAQAGHYTLPHHTRDLIHLIESEALERPVVVGWSMGVQVALELHRTHPDLAASVVAIHGTHGRALTTAFDSNVAEWISPAVFGGMRLLGRGLSNLAPLARSRPITSNFVRAGQQLGVMAARFDLERFEELAEQWLGLDMRVYAEIFSRMHEHDALDLLPAIDTPTLIVAGGGDRFTPSHLAVRMANEMPDAQLHVVPDATHFGLLEYPDQIADAMSGFLEKKRR